MSTETNVPKLIRVTLRNLRVHPVAKRDNYDERELKALGKSLRENGQLHPVLVREVDGQFELLAGTRRMRAAESVGLRELNATVCRATDSQALELIGVENLLRAELNPLERSRYVIELLRPAAYGGGGLSIDDVRKRFGRTPDWIRKTCKLSRIPDPWRARLATGDLSESLAVTLLPYVDKPAVLKSIERHQEKHSSKWTNRTEWSRLAKMIDAKFNKLDEEEGWTEKANVAASGRELKAALTPDPYAEERLDRQADKIETAMDEDPEANLVPRKLLTAAAAHGVIAPFNDSIEDLTMLNRAILERLELLEADL